MPAKEDEQNEFLLQGYTRPQNCTQFFTLKNERVIKSMQVLAPVVWYTYKNGGITIIALVQIPIEHDIEAKHFMSCEMLLRQNPSHLFIYTEEKLPCQMRFRQR